MLIPALECVSRWHYERGQDCLTPEYTTGLSAFTILNGKLLADWMKRGIVPQPEVITMPMRRDFQLLV